MKNLAASLLLACCASLAHAAPPSAESVEKLLEVMRTQDVLDAVHAQLERVMRQGMQGALSGKTLTAAQRRALDALPRKLTAAMAPELSWPVLKPDFVRVYSEVYTQEEVDGMAAFYASPLGQGILAKMPQAMQRSMELTQARMVAAMPRLQAAMAAAMKEIKAEPDTSPADPPPAAPAQLPQPQ